MTAHQCDPHLTAHQCDPHLTADLTAYGPLTELRLNELLLAAVTEDEPLITRLTDELMTCPKCWGAMVAGLLATTGHVLRTWMPQPVMALELQIAALRVALEKDANGVADEASE